MKSYKVAGPVRIEIADASSNRVMQTVTVTQADASTADAGAGTPGTSVPSESPASATGSVPYGGQPSGFHDAVAEMMRNLPVAGPKVTSVQWPSAMRAKVAMDNFQMDAMPPFARDKFLADIKSGLDSAKKAHQVATTVTIDIADAASGRVMESVSQ
jgi:hypothetical protein